MKKIKQERTLVLMKPDGVMRGLTGEVIKRIERRGLKVVALKMVQVDRKHLENHFPKEDSWVERLGEKGLKTFAEYKLDPKQHMGTDDKKEIGKVVKESLFDYMTSGPVVAMVIEGIHAIDMVRKLAGHTLPAFAEMGTIRGDFSVDSPAVANVEKRAVKNIMHASETPEEAKNEIDLWFEKDEIHDYRRAEESVAFDA
ncbi:MAG: nucleoside-diphosphate kinase [bacterium]|nr:nucleoside-diphosphate kinase [bacterium]MDZ4247951.1 nucleoside-diphosphate kinase [Patescibacteria group bacterium]